MRNSWENHEIWENHDGNSTILWKIFIEMSFAGTMIQVVLGMFQTMLDYRRVQYIYVLNILPLLCDVRHMTRSLHNLLSLALNLSFQEMCCGC